jgi:hypothetical protein
MKATHTIFVCRTRTAMKAEKKSYILLLLLLCLFIYDRLDPP